RHFKLGFKEPVIEKDYEPLTREQLTVWDDKHPAPKAEDPDFERALLKWFADDAEKQLRASSASPGSLRQALGGAVEILAGRTLAGAGDVEWQIKNKQDQGSYVDMNGLLRNTTFGEELPVAWLHPKQWNGRVVVWLDDAGKSALYNADGSAKPAA